MTAPPRLHVVYQDEIVRGIDPASAIEGAGAVPRRLDTSRWQEEISALQPAGKRVLFFVSLRIARHIQRTRPDLAGGVILAPEVLRHHAYGAILPADMLLNPRGIYLPWSRLTSECRTFGALFGERVFIRPDSPMKPFTGFAVCLRDLAREHSALSQTERVDPAEMCFVAPALDLPERETRVWCVEGRAVTSACYGWTEASESGEPAGPEIIAAAERVAQHLEYHERILTADFVTLDGAPKLVEVNAMTTSGWYRGMDAAALVGALDREML